MRVKIKDIFKVYRGEVRVYNLAYKSTISIMNTRYGDWAKMDYLYCDVVSIAVELKNTAEISSRLILFINDVDISDNYDECRDNEATDSEVLDIISELYSDTTSESTSKSESESASVSESIYHSMSESESLSTATSVSMSEYQSELDMESENEKDVEEATDKEVMDILEGIYN